MTERDDSRGVDMVLQQGDFVTQEIGAKCDEVIDVGIRIGRRRRQADRWVELRRQVPTEMIRRTHGETPTSKVRGDACRLIPEAAIAMTEQNERKLSRGNWCLGNAASGIRGDGLGRWIAVHNEGNGTREPLGHVVDR